MALDGRKRASDARVGSREEPHRRQQQDAGIEHFGSVGFDERILAGIEPLVADIPANGIAEQLPSIDRPLQTESLGALDGAVKRDPSHDLGGNVMLTLAAALPDAMIRVVPDLRKMLQHLA